MEIKSAGWAHPSLPGVARTVILTCFHSILCRCISLLLIYNILFHSIIGEPIVNMVVCLSRLVCEDHILVHRKSIDHFKSMQNAQA